MFESLSQVADAVRVHCLMVVRPRMIYIAGNPAGLFLQSHVRGLQGEDWK